MSTVIITKTKIASAVVPLSNMTIAFDPAIPANTSARAEMSFDKPMKLSLISLSTDPEVSGEVRVLLDGSEQSLLALDENNYAEADIDEEFGELLIRKLVLIARTVRDTTMLRQVVLKYSGALYEFR